MRVGDDSASVTVRVDKAVSCARCAAGKGCGAGLTSGAGRALELELRVPDSGSPLRVGDSVQLNLLPGNLLRAALLAYGVPLAGAALAAAMAFALGASEPASVTAALAGLMAGMIFSAYRTRRLSCLGNLSPHIEVDASVGR